MESKRNEICRRVRFLQASGDTAQRQVLAQVSMEWVVQCQVSSTEGECCTPGRCTPGRCTGLNGTGARPPQRVFWGI